MTVNEKRDSRKRESDTGGERNPQEGYRKSQSNNCTANLEGCQYKLKQEHNALGEECLP